jgi:hypothetical protein
MNIRSLLALSVTCSMLAGCPFLSSFRRSDYRVGTYPFRMNRQFQRLAGDCRIFPQVFSQSELDAHDFIPTDLTISQADALRVPVEVPWHANQVFLYPFTRREMLSYVAFVGVDSQPATSPDSPTESHLLQPRTFERSGVAALEADVIPQPMAGVSDNLYRQACSSYVSVRAGAGVSLPAASVQSALESQYSAGGRASVLAGTFNSPFASMYASPDYRGLYARLLLWQRYRETPALAAEVELYLLRQFSGAVLHSSLVTSSGTRASVQSSVGGSAGVASGSAEASASFEFDSKASRRTYSTMITRLSSDSFVRLDGPEAIVQRLREVGAQLVAVAEEPLASNRTNTHRVTVAGVPGGLCSGGWSIANVAPATFYRNSPTVRAIEGPFGAPPQCTFEISGYPLEATINTPDGPPALSYELVAPPSTAIRDLRLKIPVQNVQLSASRHPVLAGSTPTADAVASGEQVSYVIRVPFEIIDSGNPVDRSAGAAYSVHVEQLQCPSGQVQLVAMEVNRIANQQFAVQLRTQLRNPAPSPLRYEECRASASLRLPMVPNGTVVRELPIVVALPVVGATRVREDVQVMERSLREERMMLMNLRMAD